METTLNSPPTNLFILRYTSTYANNSPTIVDRIPTKNPTLSVLVIAVVKVGILNILLNTLNPKPPSPTKESTKRIASG